MRKSTLVSEVDLAGYSLWERIKAKRIPLSFNLEITARCNNRCRHCYINLPANDREAGKTELSSAEIMGIAGNAVSLGALWCLITGGEPLLRKDFVDIYLGLKKMGLLVSVFTNATLITPEHVELFRKYPPRDIEVTVYGVTRETYEKVTRAPGSFARFRHGLDLLLRGGVTTNLKAIAIRSNFRELPEIAEFCRRNSRTAFRFDPLIHLRFDGNSRRNREIAAERLSPAEIVALEQADPERFRMMEKECDKLIAPEVFETKDCGHLIRCGAGDGTFSVSYDGLFRLCASLWHPDCIYDLRQGKLSEAWRKLVPRVRNMSSRRKAFLERCGKCHIANLCLWCPGHSHLESGKLDEPVEYFCRVAHARAEALKKAVNGK